MQLIIKNNHKKNLFISLFGQLKNFTTLINMMFFSDHIYIQGMDKSHVCLYDIKLKKDWFDSYDYNDNDIKSVSFVVSIFHKIIMTTESDNSIKIYCNSDSDNIFIDLLETDSNGIYSKKGNQTCYKLPLTDYDEEILSIPENTEYDSEFMINSNKLTSITNNMMNFGDTININSNDENIKLSVTGESAEMTVIINVDDLLEYSINEGEEILLSYSINYLNKLCLTNKLSENIHISYGNETPMRIKYDLDNDSCVLFYLAPKIDD